MEISTGSKQIKGKCDANFIAERRHTLLHAPKRNRFMNMQTGI